MARGPNVQRAILKAIILAFKYNEIGENAR